MLSDGLGSSGFQGCTQGNVKANLFLVHWSSAAFSFPSQALWSRLNLKMNTANVLGESPKWKKYQITLS